MNDANDSKELEELRESCHRLINYISKTKTLRRIKNILERLVRSVG